MKVILSIISIIFLLTLGVSIVFMIQPLHIPFLGSADHIDEDKAITTYLITGNENKISFLTENEFSHMVDVKHIFDLAVLIMFVSFGILMLSMTSQVHRQIIYVPLLFFVVLVILALTPFTELFLEFHEVFFPQGNYLFPFDSILIQTYPETFFQAMFLLIGLFYLIGSLGFTRLRCAKKKV